MSVGSRLRSLGSRAVGNNRTVLLTYPGLRLGNVLYFALHANLQQASGVNYRVLDPGPDEDWRRDLPSLNSLLLHPSKLRLTDHRAHIPPSFLQTFGDDFTRTQLEQFVRDRLSDVLRGTFAPDEDMVVLNVRRGDYYSDPTFRSLFGFDVPDYTRRAIAALEQSSGPANQILVVSDDPTWCTANLGFLDYGRRSVRFSAGADTPLDNLRSIAQARRLVITNSTFSYWGAYASSVLHADPVEVWAPDLHSRGVRGGRPWQHDPRWHALPVSGV